MNKNPSSVHQTRLNSHPMRTSLLVLLAILVFSIQLHSQDVPPVSIVNGSIPISATFQAQVDTNRLPFIFAWNWGPGLQKSNLDLHINVFHIDNPWTWSTPPLNATDWNENFKEINKTPFGTRLIFSPGNSYGNTAGYNTQFPWYAPMYELHSALVHSSPEMDPKQLNFTGDPLGLIEGLGIRFQPELCNAASVFDTTVFTARPNDTQGAVFGFRTRDHGFVPTSTADPNYSRFVLTKAGVTSPIQVLADSWPSQKLAQWVELKNNIGTHPFNGRRMYLSVNLRRTDVADVANNDDKLLTLKIHYQLCNGTTGQIIFDSVPDPNGTRTTLPVRLDGSYRGLAANLVNRSTTTPADNELEVTRRMLPPGNATNRDVTVSGHFILGSPWENDAALDPTLIYPDVLNFNAEMMREVWNVDKPCSSPEADLIVDMRVEVIYHGNSDIAIDWVQIGSDNMTRFTQGYFDELAREAYEKSLRCLSEYNGFRTGVTGPADELRILRWYNRDEGNDGYWEAMRYFHILFDRSSTTEKSQIGPGQEYDRYHHITEDDFAWDGESMKLSPTIFVPYYQNGTGGSTTNQDALLQTRWGISSTQISEVPPGSGNWVSRPADYDLRWGAHADGTVELPFSTVVSTSDYPNGETAFHGGLQQRYEAWRHHIFKDHTFLFNRTHPWYANIWAYADWKFREGATPAENSPIPVPALQRAWTGEEVRLDLWSQLILGTKGFIYYWGAASDSLPDSDAWRGSKGGGHDLGISHQILSKRTGRNSTWAEGQNAALMSADVITDAVGPDFLGVPLDRTGLSECINNLAASGHTFADIGTALGVSANRIYLGSKSIRRSMLDVHNVVNANLAVFGNLELQAWFSHGFREWTVDPDNLYDLFLSTDDSRYKSRHPKRFENTPAPSMKTKSYEPYDSTFVEFTILKDRNTPNLTDEFYVGALNRRAHPLEFGDGTNTFKTTVEFLEYVRAGVTPSIKAARRYTQRGARQLTIPFNYSHPDGQYRNLRVQEIAIDSAAIGQLKIDTLIGQDKNLEVNFLPGEGKIFKVTPEVANETTTIGFLDHSNQRKMVAFPEVDGFTDITDPVDGRQYKRIVVGDRMWYHQVYHKRRLPHEGGNLSVYYRRSQPIRTTELPGTQYVFDASVIQWEPEILVSDHVIDAREGVPPRELQNLSCGYPAIVVRPDPNDLPHVSKVYIVFGCEDGALPNRQILVCETVLPAEVDHALQVAHYATFPSETFDATPDVMGHGLTHWGTPMVNASQSGNFYCWNHAINDIVVGYKLPGARNFLPGQIQRNIRALLPNESYAAHPSLNSYSRLQIGEEDAALVWQEGETPQSGQIFYTRLFHEPAPLNTIKPIRLYPGAPPANVSGAGFVFTSPTIGAASPPNVVINDVSGTLESAYPTVYRHLSDWETMSLNSRHVLRLVNHKAERIYWQSRITAPTVSNWMIGRMAVDISDNTARALGSDHIFNLAAQFIFDANIHLKGPNAAQGEQWGEIGSNPQDDRSVYQDSCGVLNFWQETNETDMTPTIWHMNFGWSFYGATVNHTPTDLINLGLLTTLDAPGRFPQLASRYSMSAHRGWQRNRRIFDAPGGVWPAFAVAPQIFSSSEHFYKERVAAPELSTISYVGFRNNEHGALASPIYVHATESYIPLNPISASEIDTLLKEHDLPKGFASEWVTLPEVTELTFATLVNGRDGGCRLTVQRESDTASIDLDILRPKRQQRLERTTFLTTAKNGERYKFSLLPLRKDLFPSLDIEIVARSNDATKLKKPALQDRVLDLKTMSQWRVDSVSMIQVYPNPVMDAATVVLDLKQNTTVGKTVNLVVLDNLGREMMNVSCNSLDVVRISTATWAAGSYIIVARQNRSFVQGRGTFTITR